MLSLGEKPTTLSAMPSSNPPAKVSEAFDIVKKAKGLEHVKLHYISNKIAKSYCPSLVSIGRIGCADYDTNTCYIVESDFGEFTSMMVALHELRHFYDGPHPWPEEKGAHTY